MATQTVATAVGIHRVLVAVDFSEASERALRHAITITRSYGAKFYLTHVVSAMGFKLAGGDATELAMEGAEHDLRSLEEVLATTGALNGIQHESEVCHGEVWQELERVANEKHVDLVVVGTRGRTGLRKLALGSVAEEVFQHSLCPVLTVGPRVPSDLPANATIFLSAVDMKDGKLVATGSRTVAVVGIGNTIGEAEAVCEQVVRHIPGPFFHRRDIGTDAAIAGRVDHMNQVRSA